MNSGQKTVASALTLIFICVYPFLACWYGMHCGPMNVSDKQLNLEWTYGIEVLILPIAFYLLFLGFALFILRTPKS